MVVAFFCVGGGGRRGTVGEAGLVAVEVVYPHGEEFVREGVGFRGDGDEVFFEEFFLAAAWMELAEGRRWRLMNSAEVIWVASPSRAMA